MPVESFAMAPEFYDVMICYFIPFFLIILSAPVDAFMPWHSPTQQREEVYTFWTPKAKKMHSKTEAQEYSALTALFFGIGLLAVVLFINLGLDLPRLARNSICLGAGIITTIFWVRYGRKHKKNSDKYK